MAKRKPYTVTVVNPSKKKRSKKKPAKKKASKPVAKKRRRRSSKKRAPRRRRSRRNPSRARSYAKRATRRGSFMGGFVLNPTAPLDGILARLAGKVVVAFAVRRWGDKETSPTSDTTGKAWTFKNYAIALLASYLGGELVARFAGVKNGENFYAGGVDMTATKLMWSELIHRWPTAAKALGRGDRRGYMGQMDALAAQATEGDILDDGSGNRWLMQGGKWVAMMGGESEMGQIKEADYLGDVVEATPMGQVVEADYLGHLQPQSATMPAEAKEAQFLRRGSPDPYHAAYL